jgi:hypothetical protein
MDDLGESSYPQGSMRRLPQALYTPLLVLHSSLCKAGVLLGYKRGGSAPSEHTKQHHIHTHTQTLIHRDLGAHFPLLPKLVDPLASKR